MITQNLSLRLDSHFNGFYCVCISASLHHAPPSRPAVRRTTAVSLVTAQTIKKGLKLHRAEKPSCRWNKTWLVDGISFQPLTIGPLRFPPLYFNMKYYARVVMARCLWWDFDGPSVCPACPAECLDQGYENHQEATQRASNQERVFSFITQLIPQKMVIASQQPV